MAVYVFANEKGGSGKTTHAVMFLIWLMGRGRRVLFVNTDPQPTSTSWINARHKDYPHLPVITKLRFEGDSVDLDIRQQIEHYDDIVVDTPGADTDEMRLPMLVADVVITPSKPSQFDMYSMSLMDRAVRSARAAGNKKLKAYIVGNEAPTHHLDRELEEMLEACGDLSAYEVLPFSITNRKAYRTMAKTGLIPFEADRKDEKALAELTQLYHALTDGQFR
jgi:chromosome partitioning protein